VAKIHTCGNYDHCSPQKQTRDEGEELRNRTVYYELQPSYSKKPQANGYQDLY
jgi:hypothetical protein